MALTASNGTIVIIRDDPNGMDVHGCVIERGKRTSGMKRLLAGESVCGIMHRLVLLIDPQRGITSPARVHMD